MNENIIQANLSVAEAEENLVLSADEPTAYATTATGGTSVTMSGVYKFQNTGSYKYATVYMGYITSGTKIMQYGGTAYQRPMQWRIKHVGNGKHTIRPMHKLNLAMTATSSSVVCVKDIGDVDSSCIASRSLWTIEKYGAGYIFRNASYPNKVLATIAGNMADFSDLQLLDYSTDVSATNQRWYLAQFSSVQDKILLYKNEWETYADDAVPACSFTKRLETKQFHAAFYSASDIRQDFIWESSDKTIVRVSPLGLLSARGAGTATITVKYKHNTAIYRQISVKVTIKKAIIIIPGIMGSELEANSKITYDGLVDTTYSKGTKLWAPIDDDADKAEKLAALTKIKVLACDEDGDPLHDITVRNDDNYGALDQYKTLYTYLDENFGGEYSIDFFAYDWRASNQDSASRLNTYVNSKKYEHVVIVAHSMGGIVASHYLNLGSTQRNKVKTFISLGTPYFGSLDIINTYRNHSIPMVNKWYEKLAVDFSQAIDIAIPNIPSVYQLIPNEHYHTIAGKNYLKSYSGECSSYAEDKSVLQYLLRDFNKSLFDKANEVDASLYWVGKHITQSVNGYYIAGSGIDTYDTIDYMLNEYYCEFSSSGDNGDGTVPVWSADMGGKYPSCTYYAENRNHTGSVDGNGKVTSQGLIVSDNVLKLVKELINGNTSINISGITQTKPY